MTTKTTRSCAYCGASKMTAEHVWPLWLRQVAGPREIHARDYRRDEEHVIRSGRLMDDGTMAEDSLVRGRLIPTMNTTVKVVCASCNNGWMSSLETRTRPILRALIEGHNNSISPEDAQLLAFWAFKTASMFQFHDPASRAITTDAMQYSRDHMAPPPGARVYVFRAKHETHAMTFCHQGAKVMDIATNQPPAVPNWSATTLMAHQIGFLVTYNDQYAEGNGPELSDVHLLWPPTGVPIHLARGIEDDEVAHVMNYGWSHH